MASESETIVLLKWTFILESHHLLDLGWTPPNGHVAYGKGTFSLKQVIWGGEWKPLAQMVVETSISRPQFQFGMFSWLGNCKHNMWPASHLLCSRHRTGPACPWAIEEADGRCVGSHYSAVQWPRDGGTLDRFDSAHCGGYRKAHKAQKGWAEPLEGAFRTGYYCGHIIFFLNYGRQRYFSVFYVPLPHSSNFDH